LELPVRHGALPGARLPVPGHDIVVHECVAEQLARRAALAESLRRFTQGARQRERTALSGITARLGRRLELVLDAPDAGAEARRHGDVRVDVGCSLAILDA